MKESEAPTSGKTVAESRTSMTEVVLPNDANTHGNILGGRVMHLIDLAGAIAAFRHSRKPVVTVLVDSVRFLHPIRVGQLILLEAVVNRTFTTSMEVQVQVFSEDPLSGTRTRTSEAFLTFVAVDAKGRPTRVVPLIPVSKEEKRRFREAERRRRRRLKEASGTE